MIITPAGKRVESTSWQQRKGDMTYRLVDPLTEKETDSRRVIAGREDPLYIEGLLHRRVSDGFQCAGRMASNVLEGSGGLSETDAPERWNLRPATKAKTLRRSWRQV